MEGWGQKLKLSRGLKQEIGLNVGMEGFAAVPGKGLTPELEVTPVGVLSEDFGLGLGKG